MLATKSLRMTVSLLFAASFVSILACGGGGGGNTPPPIIPDSVNNTLTVTVTGNGTVISSPIGIDCGSDCSHQYSQSTQVTLTATPATGYLFSSWSGDCSGSSSCSFDMNSNRSVSAVFIEEPSNQEYSLDVTITGSGSVTSSPAGIDCGSDCTHIYSENTNVILTASPSSGFVLSHWTGACSGNVTCQIEMNENKAVTAIFSEPGQSPLLIQNYSAPNDAFQLGDIPNNASGITWHEGIQQYLVVRNGSALIYRYSEDFQFMGTVNVGGINNDTEGLAYVTNNEVMIVSEDNMASKLNIDESISMVDGSVPNSQQYRLLPFTVSNKGLEGVAVRKGAVGELNRVYACQEGTGTNSEADMRVVYFDMPEPDPNILLSYDNNLDVIEPFNAEQAFSGVVTDLAGMLYDDRTGHLIIVSQEGRKALQVEPETGAIISQLDLTGAPQFEGVTLGPEGELVFVSEPNSIRIYTLN